MPIEWIGIVLALAVIVPLPRRALFILCDVLSRVMYRLDRRGRCRSLANLRIIRRTSRSEECLDPDKAEYHPTLREARIIRRSYRNMARSVGYAFWTMVRARVRCQATGEMGAAARDFLKANRPAVTVSGHIGCWEILSQLAYLEGHPMMSVAKDIGTRGN